MTSWVAHLCVFWINTSPWNLIKMHTWFQMCIRVSSSSCSYGLYCGLSNWRICGSEHCVVDSRGKNNTIGLPRKMVVMQFCNMTTIVDTNSSPMIITIHCYIRWIFENSWLTLCPNHIIKNLTKISKKKTLMGANLAGRKREYFLWTYQDFFYWWTFVIWQQNETSATYGKNPSEKWLSKAPQIHAPKLTGFKEQFLKLPYLDNSFQQIAKIW